MLLSRRQFLRKTLLTGGGILALSGCDVSAAERPNVLWIVNDSSRAQNYSCYGYHRPTSPNIDQFAEQGTLFERAYSQAFWTAPSVSSYMSSRYFPERCTTITKHGAAVILGEPKDEILAPTVFAQGGYKTLLVTSNLPWVAVDSRLGQAFHQALAVPEVTTWGRFYPNGRPMGKQSFAAANEIVFSWLKRKRNAPFFIYLHAMATHRPYLIPPKAPFNQWIDEATAVFEHNLVFKMEGNTMPPERVQHLYGLYDGCIRYADHHFAKLVDYLDDTGLLENTIVVYTSDHGEALYDDERTYGHTDWKGGPDETHWVPLVMSGPGIPKDKRIDTPAQLIDVLPTLMELCGIETDSHMDGRSLVPQFTSKPAKPRYALTRDGSPTLNKTRRIILCDSEYKYERNFRLDREFLWTVPDPLAARKDVKKEKPDRLTAMRQYLQQNILPLNDFAAENRLPKAYLFMLGHSSFLQFFKSELSFAELEDPESSLLDVRGNKWISDMRDPASVSLACLPGSEKDIFRAQMMDIFPMGAHRFMVEMFADPENETEGRPSMVYLKIGRGEFSPVSPDTSAETGWVFVDAGAHTFEGRDLLEFQIHPDADRIARFRRLVIFDDAPGAWEKAQEVLIGRVSQEQMGDRLKNLKALGYLM